MPFVGHTPPPPPACRDPQHDPPRSIVLEEGEHVWECPGCKQQQRLVVPPKATCMFQDWSTK